MQTKNDTSKPETETKQEAGEGCSGATCSRSLWFCYSPDDGYEEYATEELAKKAAEDALESYRDDAPGDGWSEEVWGIRYGKIHGWIVETMRKSKPPAEELDEDGQDADGTYWGEWDEICDYGISSENVDVDAPALAGCVPRLDRASEVLPQAVGDSPPKALYLEYAGIVKAVFLQSDGNYTALIKGGVTITNLHPHVGESLINQNQAIIGPGGRP